MITAKATEKDKNKEAGDARRGGVARAEACAQVGVEMRPEVTEQLHRPVGSSQGAREGPGPGRSGACRPLGRNTGGWGGGSGFSPLGRV